MCNYCINHSGLFPVELLSCDCLKLIEYGGHIGVDTGHITLDQMKLLKKTHHIKERAHTKRFLKEAFLDNVISIVCMEEIPPEFILNWDQTGINLIPASSWTMDQKGAERGETMGVNNKH